MKRIENLEELNVGDWIKVYERQSHIPFKIGEIIEKWKEKNNSCCFELRIVETNLPLSTEQLIARFSTEKEYSYIKGKCGVDDKIYKLDEEDKIKLFKKMILDKL